MRKIINAAWPCCEPKEYVAVAIYDTDDKGIIELEADKIAWVEYKDTLIEAIHYIGDDKWILDDIGLGNITTKSVDELYPNADKLEGTGWHLEPYQVDHCPGEYFWKPVKN